jgi:hypothetical protein
VVHERAPHVARRGAVEQQAIELAGLELGGVGSPPWASSASFCSASMVEYLKPVSRNWLVKARTRNGTRYLPAMASVRPKFEVGSPSGQPKCAKVSRPT